MVLDNFVRLEPGVSKRLHFTSHAIGPHQITDSVTGQPKTANALVFTVDREDGLLVSKTFSVLSEKLAQSLAPHLTDGGYKGLDFIITKSGQGFRTRYQVAVVPALVP